MRHSKTDKTQNNPLDRAINGGKRGFFKLIRGRFGLILLFLILDLALLAAGFVRFRDWFNVIFGSSVLLAVAMITYILNSRHNPSVKLTWCVLMAAFPLLGAALYIFIKLDIGHRAERRTLNTTVKETAEHRVQNGELIRRLEREDRQTYGLSGYLSRCGFDTYDGSDVRYFPSGEDKFAALKEELMKAERFIFMEYFIVAEGRFWGEILDILVKKARRGVEVRFMFDGTCAFTCLPYSYPKQLEAQGVQCRMFAPFEPFVTTSYNNRDHRKIAVIDGRVAFTGGVNLADEYINEGSRLGHWKDAAVMIRGEAVRSFTLMFLQMWCLTDKVRDYESYLPPPESVRVEGEGLVIPYADTPMDMELTGEMVYLHMINCAREYVSIMTPYLILDNETVTALTFAAKRGVDVRIILPHVPDKAYAFALAKTHYKELISAGVRIFEYTPGFVHAKVVVADGESAVVGTINFDYRSLYHHFECAAFLYKVPAIADIMSDFRRTQSVSQEVTMEDVRREKLTTKAMGAALKIIAPLL